MPYRSQSILIVDDNSTERILARAMLERLGFSTIHEAENGDIARKKLSTAFEVGSPYNFVLLDWNMSGGSGLSVLRFIRSTKNIKFTKVVIMTASSTQENVEVAIESQVDDFLVKPLTLDLLKAKIEKLKI
jgi:FOG: CheY-like receiver